MKQLTGQDTIVNSSLMETSTHGTQAFPFALYLDDFSNFKNDSICWHWHEEIQITYIHEGEFICHVGSEKMHMFPGDLIFINSRALHQIVPCRRNSGKLYAFLWRAELFSQPDSDLFRHCIAPLINSPMRHALFTYGHELNKQIRSSLHMIINATLDSLPYYELRICSQLTRIWLRLCEHSSGVSADATAAQLHALEKDEEKVRLAMSFIQENFSAKLSLDSVAKAAFTNRSELCRCFRRVLDLSPSDFILQYRLNRALALLENPELRIADIAIICGFCSPSHFGSLFSKHFGCTPLQYRKEI